MRKIILRLSLFLIISSSAHSQCSMCRVVAESSQNNGSSIANSLNSGILYLMMFPYILLLFGLISIYLREKKNN